MSEPLRVLFCMGINQNFFDLPKSDIGVVWKAFAGMLADIEDFEGVDVLGNMDDDSFMVGPSPSWPWTCYVLADVKDAETVKNVCNLFRTTEVFGGDALWKYAKIEARIGRALTVRPEVNTES